MNLTTNELINLKYMMKVISIATWLMLLILAGCSDASPSAEEPSAQERTITLNLDITTKTTAPVEESPDNFHLWIFNGDNLLKYIGTNPDWEEIYSGGIDLKATIKTEIDATGITEIQFYLLLNVPEGKIINANDMTPNSLKALTFTLPEKPYSHDNKVPMSGKVTLDIFPSQLHYDVRIDATRCVAKLAIYCTKSSKESDLTIHKVTLNSIPDKGALFNFNIAPADISYSGGKELLSSDKVIKTAYTELSLPTDTDGSWSEEVEQQFTNISTSYLLENLDGGDNLQINGIVNDNRYYVTLEYTLNGIVYTQIIYLPQMLRNQFRKIYIRINDAITVEDIYCQINSWTTHEMDVPAFE